MPKTDFFDSSDNKKKALGAAEVFAGAALVIAGVATGLPLFIPIGLEIAAHAVISQVLDKGEKAVLSPQL